MAQLELPNGKFIEIPDDAKPEEIERFKNEVVNNNQEFTDPDFDKGILAETPDPIKNNWLFDNIVVAPYEGSRKAINAASGLAENIGDTIGAKFNIGGFRYGSDANNGIAEYVPYDQAVKDGNVDAIFSPITGKIGKKDAFHTKGFFYDPSKENPEENTETTVAKFVESGFQFITGYALGGVALKGAKVATTAQAVSKATVQGAIGDFVAFDESTGRFTDVVTEYFPSVKDTWLSYLESDKNDTWYEARFKNSLEGIGLGLFAEFLFRSAKWSAGKSQGWLDDIQASKDEKIITEAQQAIINSRKLLDEATTISEKMKIVNTALENVEGLKQPKLKNKEDKIVFLQKLADDDLKINYEKYKAGELSAEEAFSLPRSWINLDTIDPKAVTEDFMVTLQAMNDTISNGSKKVSKDFSDEVIKSKAVNDYGGDLNKVYKDFQSLSKNIDDTAGLIYSHEIQLNSLIGAIPALQRQVKMGTRSQADVDKALAYLFNMQQNRANVASNTGGNLRTFGITKKEFNNLKIIEDNLTFALNELENFGKSADGSIKPKAKEKFLEKLATLDNPGVARKALNFVFTNKVWDVANEVWINALLSNPKTQIGNLLSNAIAAVVRPIEDKLGSRISMHLSKNDIDKYKVYERQLEEAQVTASGLIRYLGDSVKLGGEALRRGQLILEGAGSGAGKLDTITTKSVPGLAGEIIRTPGRLLTAGDEVFKQINYRSKLQALGTSKAKELGLKGKQFKEFIDQYFKDGFDENGIGINAEALQYAQENTFTNELSGVIARFQGFVNDYPIMKQLFPFIRTPTQIAKYVIDRTPLALPYRFKHLTGRSNDVKAIVQARGQMAMGTILLSSAYLLAEMGVLQGATNNNPGMLSEGDGKSLNKFTDRELMRLKRSSTNFKPYSFRIGNVQIPFGRLDPYGSFFGLIADIQNNYNRLEQEKIEELGAVALLHYMNIMEDNPISSVDKIGMGIKASLSAVKDNVLSKTYLQGIHDVVDTAYSDDPKKIKKFFVNKVGSYWPNIANKIANDPYLRHANTILDEVKKRTGFGSPISPEYNFLGEAHRNPEKDGLRFVNNFLNPVPVGTIKKDIIAEELFRLGKAPNPIKDIMNGTDISQYKFGKITAKDRLNQLLNTTKVEGLTIREKLEQLIQSENYQNLTDPIKMKNVVSDNGSKYDEINRIYNIYIDEAESSFEAEKSKFKFTDDDRRNLANDQKIQKRNKQAVSNLSRNANTLARDLQPLIGQ
jgi:hypothetical protein